MLDEYISKQIVLAQIASEGGKGKSTTVKKVSSFIPLGKLYSKKGYLAKDTCICKAIKAIQKNPSSGFYYHVKVEKTFRNNSHRFIVYFNFKLGDERLQISFHTYANMWKFVNQKCTTRWQKKHSSIDSAIRLAYTLRS